MSRYEEGRPGGSQRRSFRLRQNLEIVSWLKKDPWIQTFRMIVKQSSLSLEEMVLREHIFEVVQLPVYQIRRLIELLIREEMEH